MVNNIKIFSLNNKERVHLKHSIFRCFKTAVESFYFMDMRVSKQDNSSFNILIYLYSN